jgi:hypothetical protein
MSSTEPTQDITSQVSLIEKDNDKPRASTDRRTFRQRLGWYAITSLLLGMLITLGALGFLWFLWLGNNNSIWQRIMIESLATRAVTVASLFIRASASVAAGVCTSMIAAVALEHGMFVFPKAAAVSSIRYLNGGPSDLLLQFWGRVKLRRELPTASFVLAMTLTTLLLQFTSTVLLSDFRPGTIPGDVETQNLTFSKSAGTEGDTNLWTSTPQSYAMFAEVPGPSYLTQDGVSDTGTTTRALIPLAQQSRSLLRTYDGPATVFDSRVVCVRPSVNATIGISDSLLSKRSNGLGVNLNGQVNATKWPDRLLNQSYSLVPPNIERGLFKCNVVLPSFSGNDSEWALTLCGVDNGEVLVSPFFYNPDGSATGSPGPGTVNILLINATGETGNWSQALEGYSEQPTGSIWKIHERVDEWVDVVQPEYNVKLSLTLCYADYTNQDLRVHATSIGNRTEPVVRRTTENYDTQGVRSQLGATIPKESPEDRGIMSLEPMTWDNSSLTFHIGGDYLLDAAFSGQLAYGSYKSVCNLCDLGSTGRVNRILVTVFQDIVRNTGSTALALQAHLTSLVQMAYYDNIQEFEDVAPAQLQSFIQVLMPRSFNGLIAVTSVICVHWLLVFVALGQFIYWTRYSMLGNAWQTVTQLHSSDTEPVFAMPSVVSDKSVEKVLSANVGNTTRVMIRRLYNSDRIGVGTV